MKGHEIPVPPPATRDSFSYDPEYKRELFDIPWPAWHDDYEMMVVAPMRLAKMVLPHFAANGRGSFVAISGIEAGQPRLPFSLGPTRLALHGFIKAQFPKCMHGLLIAAARQARGDALPTMPMRWNHRR